MSRPVAPPSGWPAPVTATLAGRPVALTALAEAVSDRYFEEFPEDLERYGEAARAWEIHDTAHCLNWAVLDVEELASLQHQIGWLADVLSARGFPTRASRAQPGTGGGRRRRPPRRGRRRRRRAPA